MHKQHGSNEIRQDPINKEWVIYAPDRDRRPNDSALPRNPAPLRPYEPDCPFCAGNDAILDSPVLCETPAEGGAGAAWMVRVIPNKFPALRMDRPPHRHHQGLCLAMEAHGRQEVIIEHPCHNRDMADYSSREIAAVIETYRCRYNGLLEDPTIAMVCVFRNHGPSAGTSLIHPHSQVIATSTVTRSVRQREEQAQQYFDDMGSCIFCRLLDMELSSGKRVVARSSHFAAFVPYSARVPFEILIYPRRHSADFGAILPEEERELGCVLKSALARLSAKLKRPDYNLIVHSYTRDKAEEPHLHWYIQVLPRIMTRAGFEMGTGFSINPTFPEDNAAVLGFEEVGSTLC